MRFIDASPQAFLLNPMNKLLSGIMPWTHVDCFMMLKYHCIHIYIYMYYIYIYYIHIIYITYYIYILHTYYVLHTYYIYIYVGLYYINTIFVPYVIHAMDHGPRAPWEGLVKDGALVPLTFTLAPGLSQPQLKHWKIWWTKKPHRILMDNSWIIHG